MRHDNDVNAMTTLRAKAANLVRAHLATPRRAVTYGLLAAATTTGVALATGPSTSPAAAHTPAPAAATATATTHPAKTTHTASARPAAHPHTTSKELRVNYKPQPNYYWCGPAATRNALSATGHNITMANLAHKMGTTQAGTNSAHDITAALNKITGSNKYHTTELAKPTASPRQATTLQHDIVTTIDDHRAVVANVAGTATDTDGHTHSYQGGHYIAVHGYRNNGHQVKIADSADPHSAHYWIDSTNLANWIATRGYSH